MRFWLSETTTFAVGAEPLADVSLNIGTPGGVAVILLRGADGALLAGQAITLDRPAGPLARQCWPTEWQSDGAGRVYIPTLEAGKHRFHVKADGSVHELVVPPLPTKDDGETLVESAWPSERSCLARRHGYDCNGISGMRGA